MCIQLKTELHQKLTQNPFHLQRNYSDSALQMSTSTVLKGIQPLSVTSFS